MLVNMDHTKPVGLSTLSTAMCILDYCGMRLHQLMVHMYVFSFTHIEKRGVAGITCLPLLPVPRFLCSKSGRVYLHKDIRLIFAGRAPDTDPDFTQVTLTTLTEGPPSPKYGPLDGPSDRTKINRTACV